MTTEARSLHRKLAQVMHEVGRIPKNGKAPDVMGGYRFVQVGDAADAIRKSLADQLLTMVPVGVQVVGQVDRPTKSGGTMTTVDLITTWRITDAESGEYIEIQSFGAGADGGDKYSGKASTSAMKYALLTGFLLSTGEDSELGTAEAGRSSRPHDDADSSPDAGRGNGKSKETEEMMGRIRRRGIVRKGTADNFKLTDIPGPEGHQLGFRLEIDGDKNIPQCAVAGPLGEALFVALGGKPETLLGKVVTVGGLLYNVRRSDKPGSWYRLHVDAIETDDWILPPPERGPRDSEDEIPDEAPSIPLFSEEEQAVLDAAVEKAGAG